MIEFSAKTKFAKGPMAQPWSEVSSSQLFIEASSAAMLQMQSNLGLSTNQVDAAANCYKMEGARIFFSILMNLTTPPEAAPPRPKRENLDHTL